jgi:hypothetical protein
MKILLIILKVTAITTCTLAGQWMLVAVLLLTL